MRKQKEKKKAKKAAGTIVENDIVGSDSESEERSDMDDPFFQTAFGDEFKEEKVKEKKGTQRGLIVENKKVSKVDRIADQKAKAELELLMMDEKVAKDAHFSVKDIIQSEKSNKSKKNKRKLATLDLQPDFDLDLNDPRFASLVEDHQFHIDPTNSQYKNTATMKKIMMKKRDVGQTRRTVAPVEKVNNSLSSLVESVKRKTKNVGSKGRRTA